MDVATLIAKLLPLTEDPIANSDEILRLLGKARALAEYEIARFVVAQRTEGFVRERLTSLDPLVRRQAIRWVELTFARAPAAMLLRDASKDRSNVVRRAAMRATRTLRIRDVALPDTTLAGRASIPATRARTGINPFTKEQVLYAARPARPAKHRGFNTTGWRFGLYPPPKRKRRPLDAFKALWEREDVQDFFELDDEAFRALCRPGAGPGAPYVEFAVPKASGGVRLLHAPRPELKRIQRRVLDELLSPLPAHLAAHGSSPAGRRSRTRGPTSARSCS